MKKALPLSVIHRKLIISREEYEKAKKRRKSTKRVIQTRERHLLDDMIFCEGLREKDVSINFRQNTQAGN